MTFIDFCFPRNLLVTAEKNHIFAEVFAKRIVPLLLTPIVMTEQTAVDHVLTQILCPNSKTPSGTSSKTARSDYNSLT